MTLQGPESAVTWGSSPLTSRLISFRSLLSWKQSPERIRSLACDDELAEQFWFLFSLLFPQLFLHLQPIFDWNVKQLFLYLSAEYTTKSNTLNQVVLWDKIILRGESTVLNMRDMKSKYFFFDDGNGLRANKNITLTLSWNVVPNAGILPLVAGNGHVSLPFPDAYETTRSY
uniref:Signal peptidase complex subunit 3 n=1 Tax=Takifugu rubripes TaxID=31033 RepID=A0A674NE26_TAKRU